MAQLDLTWKIPEQQSWRPDWTKGDLYPVPDNMTMFQWTWEFLRRNMEYQHFYYEMVEPCLVEIEAFPPGHKVRGYQWPPEHLSDQDRARVSQGGARLLTDQEIIELLYPDPRPIGRKRFGILDPFPPSPASRGPLTELEPPLLSDVGNLPDHEMLLKVDLRMPIGPQLARWKKFCEAQQKRYEIEGRIKVEKRRSWTDNFPNYLRILDADFAGASNRDIAATLYPRKVRAESSRKNLDNQRGAAEKMRDEGYRWLAGSPDDGR
jgi:hypothetical protein